MNPKIQILAYGPNVQWDIVVSKEFVSGNLKAERYFAVAIMMNLSSNAQIEITSVLLWLEILPVGILKLEKK